MITEFRVRGYYSTAAVLQYYMHSHSHSVIQHSMRWPHFGEMSLQSAAAAAVSGRGDSNGLSGDGLRVNSPSQASSLKRAQLFTRTTEPVSFSRRRSNPGPGLLVTPTAESPTEPEAGITDSDDDASDTT